MSTESRITEALEAMKAEGVPMDHLGEMEARLMNLLFRARRINKASSVLPLLGITEAADYLKCHRSTVYRLAKKSREKVA
jgi:predicted DNA-binding protein (UPF0251 family)